MARFFPNTDFIRNDDDELDDADKRKKALAENGVKVVMMFMVVVAILFAFISQLTNSTITVPKSADAILKSVNQPNFYSWSSESIRLFKSNGSKTEHRFDSVRSAAVDTGLNRFQATTVGVFPDKTLYVSDGKLTASLTEADQQAQKSWTMLTDACSNKPAFKTTLVAPPTADDFLKASPKVKTADGSVFGQRAWIIDFKLNKQIISKLLWVGFYNEIADPDSISGRFILSKDEREALSSGAIKQDYARIWVSNNGGKRLISQVDVRFRFDIPGGSRWRIFAKQFPVVTDKSPMTGVSFGKPDCSNNVVGKETAQVASPEKVSTASSSDSPFGSSN